MNAIKAPDSAIARKHIEISISAKQIAQRTLEHCQFYVATHTVGKAGQCYQCIEKESGEEFWSIKAWTRPPHHPLKDPDLIITGEKRVSFLLEVKWGTVPESPDTDLKISPAEWLKMDKLLAAARAMCRVKGPAVRCGRRYHNPEFPMQKDYFTDSQTRLVLISNFVEMQKARNAEYCKFLNEWKTKKNIGVLIADINKRVGDIPSLQELLGVEK